MNLPDQTFAAKQIEPPVQIFRTVLTSSKASFSICHADKVALIGSCFTEHIGERLQGLKFNALCNPFGIVYNPVSIAQCLERVCAGNRPFTANELFEHDGLWHSWEHHGRFSGPDKELVLKEINGAYEQGSQHLKQSGFLLLTLGTAEVHMLRETGKVVANNHKMPAARFDSRRLSVREIVEHLLRALQPLSHLQVILTVSPVRHLRNGLVENQRSKAALVLACEEICARLNHAHYFPAYELLLDDLRDYRFYAADMIHPSEVAVDYIWQYFSETFFDAKTRQLNERIEKIQAAAKHRPFHPDTDQHRRFARAQLEAISDLQKVTPALDFEQETAVFRQYL